jgi:molybdate/tungstate transport system substrate-binding protein
LESGDVDYSFEYQSVASQHGLKFLPLPPEVNLSNADYNSLYQKVSVKLDFQRFASVKPVFQGSPIVYAVTIPQNTKHAAEAAEFIRYLLGPEGRQTLNDNSQPPLVPAQADHAGKIPNSLMSLVK